MTEREALKMALDALEEINKLSVGENAICLPAEIDTAMDACRKVLAQPEYQSTADKSKLEKVPAKGTLLAQPEQEPIPSIKKMRIDVPNQVLYTAQPVPTSDTSEKRVDETAKQRHESEPVIDKSAAVRIATSLGWEPKRTWVGLTDEEMHECWDSPLTPLGMKHARMIEAKLKEKNNG